MKNFLLIFLFFSCAETTREIQIVEKEIFQSLINQNVQLIDVRTPEEFSGGHIRSAQNINYKSIDFETQISKLDKNKPILVYCSAGGRSAKASKILHSLGFKKIYDLKGGYRSWDK